LATDPSELLELRVIALANLGSLVRKGEHEETTSAVAGLLNSSSTPEIQLAAVQLLAGSKVEEARAALEAFERKPSLDPLVRGVLKTLQAGGAAP
jgi:hypothetical protein